MARQKSEHFSFKVDIYHHAVHIFIGSIASLNRWIDENFNGVDKIDATEEEMAQFQATTSCFGSDIFIYAPKELTYLTLIHEMSHAAFRILEHVGIESSENHEEYAYLYEYLIDQCMSWYNDYFDRKEKVKRHNDEKDKLQTKSTGSE